MILGTSWSENTHERSVAVAGAGLFPAEIALSLLRDTPLLLREAVIRKALRQRARRLSQARSRDRRPDGAVSAGPVVE